MVKFVVTVEYQDGSATKLTIDSYIEVRRWIDPRLDNDRAAKEVKRVTICPIVVDRR